MLTILDALGMFVADLFKSRSRLEAENLLLRHQLTIALRQAPPRLRLRGGDRAFLIWLTRLWPSLLGASYDVTVYADKAYRQTVRPNVWELLDTWVAMRLDGKLMDFCLIFAPSKGYDEPEILPS
jgi:hypothetical protein